MHIVLCREAGEMMADEIEVVAKAMGLTRARLEKAEGIKNLHKIEWKTRYYRLSQHAEKAMKGTVVFMAKDGPITIQGFPKIRRIMVLSTGLKGNFPKGCFVEEKMDGYNVRLVDVDGELAAITRGGIVCPYTTYRLSRLAGMDFFKDNPELYLCGEVVGLQNPYQEKSYPEAREFGYFVFDIRRIKDNEPIDVETKHKMLKKYGIQSVPDLGYFGANDGERLLKIVRKLGEDGREGIVLKSRDMKTQLKYTSNQSTNRDLFYAFKFYADYGQSFMYRRLVREAFQAHEAGLKGKALDDEAARLGKSILIPMIDTINKAEKGVEVTEDFGIDVPSCEFGEEFVDHLNKLGVKARINKCSAGAGEATLKISRRYPSTNDKTRAYLKGGLSSD